LITNRPEIVNTRETFGHWEGDNIIFSSSKTQSITSVVERKSRFLMLTKNVNSQTATVMNNIKEKLLKVPLEGCLTITFDQGSEFADYKQLETNIGCRVYYCEISSPWQKGTNENTNGRLRRYLPRKIDITSISQKDLDHIAKRANATPRKCLGFKTPKEMFQQYSQEEEY
jgi:IS30 family transposase